MPTPPHELEEVIAEVKFAREAATLATMFAHVGVTNNWLYGMLVGRLYYAAHHLGRRLLVEVSLQPEQWRANVHQQVLNELHQQYVATGRMSVASWRALDGLRDLRVRADYELTRPLRLRHVNHAVVLFNLFAEECYRILGVS